MDVAVWWVALLLDMRKTRMKRGGGGVGGVLKQNPKNKQPELVTIFQSLLTSRVAQRDFRMAFKFQMSDEWMDGWMDVPIF